MSKSFSERHKEAQRCMVEEAFREGWDTAWTLRDVYPSYALIEKSKEEHLQRVFKQLGIQEDE